MAQTSIRTDLHEAFYIHGHGLAKIPFNHTVSLDDVPDTHGFVFGQVLHFGTDVYGGFLANFGCPAFANAKNVSQANLNPFIQWQIHTCDSSQFLPPS